MARLVACTDCEKTFSNKQTSLDHYNSVHRGLNLHTCLYCDKKFGFKLNLSKHEKSEHSLDNVERKYGCGPCPVEQNFAELYDQNHETSQNPSKPSSARSAKRGRPKKINPEDKSAEGMGSAF